MYAESATGRMRSQGGDVVRTKIVRILISGAALATMLLAAGAKWKV
jgi:hypothetical protein